MSEPLSSLQNPRVKAVVRLLERRERRKSGLTRVDGGRELLRAMQCGLVPEELFLCEARLRREESHAALALCRDAGAPVQSITEPVYDKIRYGERDEGLCAVVRWTPATLDEIAPRDGLFLLVVEGVEKPGNLGALLRTADGAGVDAVILADPVCETTNPNTIRASMGTLFTQRVVESQAGEVIEWLAARDVPVVTTRPQAPALYTDTDLRGSIALVMGSESEGLSGAWDHADVRAVRLPMAGISDSLNLAASTAVMLYEAVRQRGAR